LAEGKGIVDHRRKEVDRLHQRPLLVDAEDTGIGKRDVLREQTGIVKFWYLTQYLGQGLGADLSGST